MSWKRFWIAWISCWMLVGLIVSLSIAFPSRQVSRSPTSPSLNSLAEQIALASYVEKITVEWCAGFLVTTGILVGILQFRSRNRK